jgi:hypothetical protein
MGIRADRLFGFSTAKQYGRALVQSPLTVWHRVFLTKSVEEQQADAEEGGGHMKRVLVSLGDVIHALNQAKAIQ